MPGFILFICFLILVGSKDADSEKWRYTTLSPARYHCTGVPPKRYLLSSNSLCRVKNMRALLDFSSEPLKKSIFLLGGHTISDGEPQFILYLLRIGEISDEQ